mmetsp:Transcript_9007/g.23625  ORF Transcript_9007/g.23625 Transcript_9007/m.23625 type:complete len:356 (-) Transcript_9007:45-1112(-)
MPRKGGRPTLPEPLWAKAPRGSRISASTLPHPRGCPHARRKTQKQTQSPRPPPTPRRPAHSAGPAAAPGPPGFGGALSRDGDGLGLKLLLLREPEVEGEHAVLVLGCQAVAGHAVGELRAVFKLLIVVSALVVVLGGGGVAVLGASRVLVIALGAALGGGGILGLSRHDEVAVRALVDDADGEVLLPQARGRSVEHHATLACLPLEGGVGGAAELERLGAVAAGDLTVPGGRVVVRGKRVGEEGVGNGDEVVELPLEPPAEGGLAAAPPVAPMECHAVKGARQPEAKRRQRGHVCAHTWRAEGSGDEGGKEEVVGAKGPPPPTEGKAPPREAVEVRGRHGVLALAVVALAAVACV